MPSQNEESIKNKKMLISSTLILVFISTVFFGALMSTIVKFFTKGKKEKRRNLGDSGFLSEDFNNYSLQGFDGETLTIGETDIEAFLETPKQKSNRIQGIWKKIDNNILKPIFIDNYNTAREEHSQIAKEIMQLFENHEKKKMKLKTMKSLNKKNGMNYNKYEDINNGIEMKEQDELNDSSKNDQNIIEIKSPSNSDK